VVKQNLYLFSINNRKINKIPEWVSQYKLAPILIFSDHDRQFVWRENLNSIFEQNTLIYPV
jgi:hypothetical protein